MNLRYRPMRPEDSPECVALVANDSVIAACYGRMIEFLPEAWLRLLRSEAAFAIVFQAEEGPDSPICFLGVSVALKDEFVRELEDSPAIPGRAGVGQKDCVGQFASCERRSVSRRQFSRRVDTSRVGRTGPSRL